MMLQSCETARSHIRLHIGVRSAPLSFPPVSRCPFFGAVKYRDVLRVEGNHLIGNIVIQSTNIETSGEMPLMRQHIGVVV